MNEYKNDLPNFEIAAQELRLWKQHCLGQNEETLPSTLPAAIRSAKNQFLNSYVSLKDGCTLLVTWWWCEKSFSEMRRSRRWLFKTMSSKQLSSLAIMNVHRKHPVNYTEIAKKLLFFIRES